MDTKEFLIRVHNIALEYGCADNSEWKPKEETEDE